MAMIWLEFIKIRTCVDYSQCLLNELLKSVSVGLELPGLVDAVIYDHASIPGDLSITLLWDTEQPENRGSKLALYLIRELKNCGMVDHSIWVKRIP